MPTPLPPELVFFFRPALPFSVWPPTMVARRNILYHSRSSSPVSAAEAPDPPPGSHGSFGSIQLPTTMVFTPPNALTRSPTTGNYGSGVSGGGTQVFHHEDGDPVRPPTPSAQVYMLAPATFVGFSWSYDTYLSVFAPALLCSGHTSPLCFLKPFFLSSNNYSACHGCVSICYLGELLHLWP